MFRLGIVLAKTGHGHSHGIGGGHNHSHGGSSVHEQVSVNVSNELPINNETEVVKLKSKISKDLNVRAAFIHAIGDLVQSIGVFFAALLIYFKVKLFSLHHH